MKEQPSHLNPFDSNSLIDNGKMSSNNQSTDKIHEILEENLHTKESTIDRSQRIITIVPALSRNYINMTLRANKRNYSNSSKKRDILSLNSILQTTRGKLRKTVKDPTIPIKFSTQNDIVQLVALEIQENIHSPNEWNTLQTLKKKRFVREVNRRRKKQINKMHKRKFNKIQSDNSMIPRNYFNGYKRGFVIIKRETENANNEGITEKQVTVRDDLQTNIETESENSDVFQTQGTNFEIPEITTLTEDSTATTLEEVNMDSKYDSSDESNQHTTRSKLLDDILEKITVEVFTNYPTTQTTVSGRNKYTNPPNITQNKHFFQNISKQNNKSLDIHNTGKSKMLGISSGLDVTTEFLTGTTSQNFITGDRNADRILTSSDIYKNNSRRNNTVENYSFENQSISNVIKMNFNFDVPDTNFTLRLERKAVNGTRRAFNHQGNLRNNRKKNYKLKKHKTIKRISFYDHLVRKRRQLKGLRSDSVKLESDMKNVPTNSFRSFAPNVNRLPIQIHTNTNNISDTKSSTADDDYIIKKRNDTFSRYSNNFQHDFQNLSANSNIFNSIFTPEHSEQENYFTNEFENKEFVFNLLINHALENSKLPLNVFDSNFSTSLNESFNGLNGTKPLYMLYLPFLKNASLLKDIKSIMWDNVHYIKERDIRKNTNNCCQSFSAIIMRNPFTTAMAIALSCMILVFMLLGVFFLAEKRFKDKPTYSTKNNPSDYKVIKNKNQTLQGEARKNVSDKEQLIHKNNVRIKDSAKPYTDNSPADKIEIDNKYFSRQKTERFDEIKSTAELDKELSFQKNKTTTKERGIVKKAKEIGRWIRRRISNVASIEDSREIDSEAMSTDTGISDYSLSARGRKSLNTDKTYVSKRQRLKKFVDRKVKRKMSPGIIIEKLTAPDLRSTLRDISVNLSSDETSVASLPATTADLRERITTTGDCKEIDDMMVKAGWERSLYTAHGLDKTGEMEENAWKDYMPEERRKIDAEKISGTSAQSIGILSRGSSSHSLKTALGKSLNTAEWVSKHPRPLSRTELKTRNE